MLVQELIEKLKEFDPKLPVALHGYEGGAYFTRSATEVTLALNVNDPEEWWYGPHEIVLEGDEYMQEKTQTHEKQQVIYIT